MKPQVNKSKKKDKKKFKLGLPPAALVFTGEKKIETVDITMITYDIDGVSEEVVTMDQLPEVLKSKRKVLWIDIDGLHDVELIEKVGAIFSIHRLTLEDILNVQQRPKMEVFDEYIFAVIKMIKCLTPESEVEEEQISFLLMDDVLVTFQEKKGDVFNYVRERIIEFKGNIRKRSGDYLLYALLDAVIDNYFLVLENVGEKIDLLEARAMNNPDTDTLNQLYRQRREMAELRRTIYPLREVIGGFDKYAEQKISPETKPFMRDLYENTIQVIETLEVFRDMSSGVLDLYMNSLSNKMNNVMKVLTIISTIFIPLSFVAGVYGMNFEHMPELHWRYGYFYVLAGMATATIGMLFYFRWKKWL
ncbi:magnesium/cobalt transporter CorA [Algoriphagus marinus]|uniref:magnesium/cobalt transporter CorA n=1 Tax=Algoriphagus marinus TaxID=1925762 RepID=UPI00094BAC4D|nr:magnesium/cobalt transporter CorA [Algoriphagus marinus]